MQSLCCDAAMGPAGQECGEVDPGPGAETLLSCAGAAQEGPCEAVAGQAFGVVVRKAGTRLLNARWLMVHQGVPAASIKSLYIALRVPRVDRIAFNTNIRLDSVASDRELANKLFLESCVEALAITMRDDLVIAGGFAMYKATPEHECSDIDIFLKKHPLNTAQAVLERIMTLLSLTGADVAVDEDDLKAFCDRGGDDFYGEEEPEPTTAEMAGDWVEVTKRECYISWVEAMEHYERDNYTLGKTLPKRALVRNIAKAVRAWGSSASGAQYSSIINAGQVEAIAKHVMTHFDDRKLVRRRFAHVHVALRPYGKAVDLIDSLDCEIANGYDLVGGFDIRACCLFLNPQEGTFEKMQDMRVTALDRVAAVDCYRKRITLMQCIKYEREKRLYSPQAGLTVSGFYRINRVRKYVQKGFRVARVPFVNRKTPGGYDVSEAVLDVRAFYRSNPELLSA